MLNDISITSSLKAIQNYSPSSRNYLKVVGIGSKQHLEAVQINWFGRLLMWLGFTNSCMKKVIRYVADNIEHLRQHGQDQLGSLNVLAGRMAAYDNRHCNRQYGLVIKIKKAMARAIPVSKPLTIDPTPPSLPEETKPVGKPGKPPIVNVPLPSLLPQPPAPSQPPAPAPSPSTPPPPSKTVVKPQFANIVDEYAYCRNDPQAVYDLLAKHGNDEAQFKKLIEAISPDDITQQSPLKNAKHFDFFDLTSDDKNFRIKPGVVVRLMSKEQLIRVIDGYFVEEWGTAVDDSLIRFMRTVIAHRSPVEQNELIARIVQSKVFASLDYIASHSSSLQNTLKTHYLVHLAKTNPQDIQDKLKQFFNKACDGTSATVEFLKSNSIEALSSAQKAMIAQALIQNLDLYLWKDLKMVTVLANDVQYAKMLFESADGLLALNHLLSECKNIKALEAATTNITNAVIYKIFIVFVRRLEKIGSPNIDLLPHLERAFSCLTTIKTKEKLHEYLHPLLSDLYLDRSLSDQLAIPLSTLVIKHLQPALWNNWDIPMFNLMRRSVLNGIEYFNAANNDPEKIKVLLSKYSLIHTLQLEQLQGDLESPPYSLSSSSIKLINDRREVLEKEIDKVRRNVYEGCKLFRDKIEGVEEILRIYTHQHINNLQSMYEAMEKDKNFKYPLHQVKDRLNFLNGVRP